MAYSGSTFCSPVAKLAPSGRLAPWLGSATKAAAPEPNTACLGTSVSLLLLVAAASLRPRSKGHSLQGVSQAQAVPQLPAFAGASAPRLQAPLMGESKVTRHGRRWSCSELYFKKTTNSNKRMKSLRNRDFNLAVKKEFVGKIKSTNKYSTALFRGIMKPMPSSLQEVWGDIKEQMDDACLTIDRACIEGVIHQQEAADRKEMLLDRLYLALKEANIPIPQIPGQAGNRYLSSWRKLGYEIPVCNWLREPRPWHLPGWKPVVELRKEFKVYLIKRRTELRLVAKQEEDSQKARVEEAKAGKKR